MTVYPAWAAQLEGKVINWGTTIDRIQTRMGYFQVPLDHMALEIIAVDGFNKNIMT